jgi:hypothetical protein
MLMLVMPSDALPLLVSVTTWAELAVPTVWSAKVRLAGENRTLAAIPVPLSGTVCGLLPALSVKVMDPVTVPVVVGVKATVILQLPPDAPPVPQVFVSEKLPEGAILEIDSLAPVLFVSLITLPALVVFTAWFANVRLVGDSSIIGVVPLPVMVTVWGLLLALSVTTTVPDKVPIAAGVKTTLTLQFPPAATELPQVLLWE